MDPAPVPLSFCRVAEIDWYPAGVSNDIFALTFATGTVKGYKAENILSLKRQNVDEGPVMLVMAPAIEVNWIS